MSGNLVCRWHRLLLVLGVLSLTGCEAVRYARLPDPNAETYSRDGLIKVMEQMDIRRAKVNSVVAPLRIVLRDSSTGKERELNGAYLGDNRGNVRMRVNFNESVVLDLAFRDQTVDLWLPRQNRFYRGERKDLQDAENCDFSLLAIVGNAHDLFFPRAWTDSAIERRWEVEDGREVVKVQERPGILRKRTVRKFVISPSKPVAERVVVYHRSGRTIGEVLYGDYHFPEPRAAGANDGPVSLAYPSQITLKVPGSTKDMQMDLVEEPQINRPIPPEQYEIKLPEGQRILVLSEALKSGKPLWE